MTGLHRCASIYRQTRHGINKHRELCSFQGDPELILLDLLDPGPTHSHANALSHPVTPSKPESGIYLNSHQTYRRSVTEMCGSPKNFGRCRLLIPISFTAEDRLAVRSEAEILHTTQHSRDLAVYGQSTSGYGDGLVVE